MWSAPLLSSPLSTTGVRNSGAFSEKAAASGDVGLSLLAMLCKNSNQSHGISLFVCHHFDLRGLTF
jgi:hypothetical protein